MLNIFLSMLNKAKHTAHMWAGGIKSVARKVFKKGNLHLRRGN